MRIFSKLFVLGAALAVSTSFAYADTMGAVALSPDTGVTVSYAVYGLNYSPEGSSLNATITGANGDLSGYLGATATLDGINFLGGSGTSGSGAINTYTNGAQIFQADGGALDYVLTSGTWSIDSHDVLTILGTGYFDVAGVDEGGDITITGSNNGIFNVETTGNLAATPEPGSLVLLGTGLLSAAGIARRKFASKV